MCVFSFSFCITLFLYIWIVNEKMAGIMFQDITTLLLKPKEFKDTIDMFVERYKGKNISVVAGKTMSAKAMTWFISFSFFVFLEVSEDFDPELEKEPFYHSDLLQSGGCPILARKKVFLCIYSESKYLYKYNAYTQLLEFLVGVFFWMPFFCEIMEIEVTVFRFHRVIQCLTIIVLFFVSGTYNWLPFIKFLSLFGRFILTLSCCIVVGMCLDPIWVDGG